jgi:very-short-patch-repair endonuclease
MVENEQNKSKSPFKEGGMFNEAHPLIFEKAKALRKNMTEAEKVLWGYLKGGLNGFKFRRQHPIGVYIADFYCHPVKLIIELDGKIHDRPEVKLLDEQRETDLRRWGYEVIRFTNEELFQNIEKVLLTIKLKVDEQAEAKKVSEKTGEAKKSSDAGSPAFREDLGGSL